MLKYHIREDGNPGICNASVRGCPLGGEDQHYASSRTAREAYESMGFHDELISQQSSYHLAAARALDARIRMMRSPRDTRLKDEVKMLDGLAESAYSRWRRIESEVFYGE